MITRLAVAGVLAAALVGTAGAAPRPSTYELPDTVQFPEGVAFQPATGRFFVSSTANGAIARGHVSQRRASPFIAGTTGQFSAIGLEVTRSRLFVAGGMTGQARVYNAATGAQVATFTSPEGDRFMNDVAVTRTGDAFVTDSFRPTLWRIRAGASSGPLEAWLDFTGTDLEYTPAPRDFEVNGIVATGDGKYLLVVQANTGELFRIDLATKAVRQINLGGATVNGDGLQLLGRRLYAVVGDPGAIVKVQLSADFTSGRVVSTTTHPSFRRPTTNAIARGRMLVVNSQFGAQNPVTPFTVTSIRIP